MRDISIKLEVILEKAMMDLIAPVFYIEYMPIEFRYRLVLSYNHNGEKFIHDVKLNAEDKVKIESGDYLFNIKDGIVVTKEK